jgi:methionyl-tRNA formyltransferase
VLTAPRIGSFNLHPGPLPEYAGLSVPSWAIYNGETRHGVTVHWMESEIDTGAIAYAETVAVTGQDTGLSLSVKCIKVGVPLVARLLEDAARDPGSIPRVPQDLSRRRYFRRAAPDQGRLRWDLPARRIVDFVRASDYAPFPSPWGTPATVWDGAEVGVARAELTGERCEAAAGAVGRVADTAAMVAAGDEWVRVLRVRVGEQTVEAAEILREGGRFTDA